MIWGSFKLRLDGHLDPPDSGGEGGRLGQSLVVPAHTRYCWQSGAGVHVSVIDTDGDHCVVGNYKGAPWCDPNARTPPGGLGLGRSFQAAEL